MNDVDARTALARCLLARARAAGMTVSVVDGQLRVVRPKTEETDAIAARIQVPTVPSDVSTAATRRMSRIGSGFGHRASQATRS